MSITAITAILTLIEQVIGMFGTSVGINAGTTALIANIITTLENLLPIILTFIPSFYQSVKGIITALSADPSTTAAQLKTLQALDAQVDAAFDAAAAAVDPDLPPKPSQPTG